MGVTKILIKAACLFSLALMGFTVKAQSYKDIIRNLQHQLDVHYEMDEKRVDLLNDLSYAHRRGSPQKIDSFAKKALYLARELNYQKGMGTAYKNLGISTWRLGGDNDSVFIYYKKCYDIAKQNQDYYNQVACSNNIGLWMRGNFQYAQAIKNFQNALEIHQKHFSVDRLRMLIMGNIGQTYMAMGDYEHAKFYLEEVTELAEKQKNEAILTMHMADYAFVQHKRNQNDNAIKTIDKYLPIAMKIGDYLTYVDALAVLSDILIEEKRLDEAETYIEQGMQLVEEHNLLVQKCEISVNQSRVLYANRKYEKAQKSGEYAYNCAKERNDNILQMKAAKNLLNIYLATQNTIRAKELFPIYNNFTKLHFDTEKQKTYARLEMEFQNKKKEAENDLLKAQQIKNQATIRVQRVLALSIIFLSLLVTGAIFYAYYTKRAQNDLLEKKVLERTHALNKSNSLLEHFNKQMAKSNEELEQFAYIASHDLKQPLNTVISFSNLLNKELKNNLNTKTETYLNFIIKSGTQMKQLIEDILEYSKLNQEKRESEVIALSMLVNEVTDSIASMIEQKKAQVSIIGKLSTIKYEKTKMVLLFKNLIENGIKYNQTKIPTIKIKQSEFENNIRLSFTDNGIGIEQKYFSTLFKMFNRLHSNKDYEGTGIGLSLCKKIVHNMGGNLSLESQPGKGSTFFVDMPKELFV